MPHREPVPQVRGFTIIELLAVLVLSALLAGIVTVSLVGRGSEVRFRDAVGQLIAFERVARDHARRGGDDASTLVYDLRRDRIRLGRAHESAPPLVLNFGKSFRIDKIIYDKKFGDSGEIRIPMTAGGRTPTYAVRVSARKRAPAQWIVWVGLSGRAMEVDDERQVQAILDAATTGDDAR